MKTKAIQVKAGTLAYTTVIAPASKDDGEAHWVEHKGKPAVHGFKAHVGADVDTALVEEIAVTPANINEGRAGPAALPDNPGEVFADSAYQGNHFGNAVRARGGTPRIVATGMWGRDEAKTLARPTAWNQLIHRIRGRIERIFGTWKRSYGLRRMRRRGLAVIRPFNCGLKSIPFFKAIRQDCSARPVGAGRGCGDGTSAADKSIVS